MLGRPVIHSDLFIYLFIYSLFNDNVSTSCHSALNGGMIMNNRLYVNMKESNRDLI
jgi:uncharacterized membrane protein